MKLFLPLLLIGFLLSIIVPASAQVTFDFVDNNDPDDPEDTNPPDQTEALDGGGLGAFVTLNDGATLVTLTTIDIIGQDGSSALSDGSEHTTNIAPNQDALAVNTADALDDGFIDGGSDSSHFNPGEAWIFSFDVDVNLTNIEVESFTAGEQTFTVSSGSTTMALAENINPFTEFFIPANTEVRIEFVELLEGGTDTQIRVESLTVEAQNASDAPNLEWSGGASGLWDTTAMNFTDIDSGEVTSFSSDDNVSFVSDASITLDSAGITAGNITGANSSPSLVTLTGGELSGGELLVTEDGTFQIGNTTDFIFTSVSQGSLEILAAGSITTDELTLSNGGSLLTAPNSSLLIESHLSLGVEGGMLNLGEDLTLAEIENIELQNSLIKTGSALLTITGEVGTQNSGAVDLEVLEGAVLFTGDSQLNIGSAFSDPEDVTTAEDSQIDGELTLDGPLLMLHGSQLVGSGQIRVQSSSTIQSRRLLGNASVQIPVVLEGDLIVNASLGLDTSDLIIEGVVSGPGNLIKQGNGAVTLNAENTYSGTTTIEAGTLQLGSNFLPDDQTLTLNETTSQGSLILTHGTGDEVEALIINGVVQPAGTYGSSEVTGVVLDNVNDTLFPVDPENPALNTGWLVVTTGDAIPIAQIVNSGFDGENFFIEVQGSTDGLIVTSSDTLDFASSSTVNATVDAANNRFLIPEAERNLERDFFRVEVESQ